MGCPLHHKGGPRRAAALSRPAACPAEARTRQRAVQHVHELLLVLAAGALGRAQPDVQPPRLQAGMAARSGAAGGLEDSVRRSAPLRHCIGAGWLTARATNCHAGRRTSLAAAGPAATQGLPVQMAAWLAPCAAPAVARAARPSPGLLPPAPPPGSLCSCCTTRARGRSWRRGTRPQGRTSWLPRRSERPTRC